MNKSDRLILVTGASGYVAGNLIPLLIERGYRVRCLVRNPSKLNGRPWFYKVEIAKGDVNHPEDLETAFQGVTTAYYLIHNMASGSNYFQQELEAAGNFGCAARSAGLQHIIYLGGLADPQSNIGPHMRSRIETGELLRQCGVPVTEFRASLIIGAGSISFEMIRFLTEQFPILVGPRWFKNHTQPIAIQNILEYLLAALETHKCWGKIYEVGGTDVISYAESMYTYARLRGLKRKMLVLPTLPIRLMATVVGLLTPVPSRIAAPLIGGMQSDSVIKHSLVHNDFPEVKPMEYACAVQQALEQLSPDHLEATCVGNIPETSYRSKGFFITCNKLDIDASPQAVFNVILSVGGKHGWLYLNWLWRLRGWLDRLVGGVGMRGKNEAKTPQLGDIVDFYHIDALHPGERLRLKADLKAPGEGWMEWRVRQKANDQTQFIQIAYFAPKGVTGFLYWYVLNPIHRLVFKGLIQQIAKMANKKKKTG